MEDIVNRQAVIDTIHKTLFEFFDVCGDDEELPISDKDKLLLKVNKAICTNVKALEQESKWIPCSERLPKEEGLYLVSVKNEHDRRYSKTCWFHGDDNWFARQDVIAWMPLPEPYKTESE